MSIYVLDECFLTKQFIIKCLIFTTSVTIHQDSREYNTNTCTASKHITSRLIFKKAERKYFYSEGQQTGVNYCACESVFIL